MRTRDSSLLTDFAKTIKPMEINRAFIEGMLPGEVMTVICRDAAAVDSLYRLSMQLRADCGNAAAYSVSRGVTTQTVTIRRWALPAEQDSKLTRMIRQD